MYICVYVYIITRYTLKSSMPYRPYIEIRWIDNITYMYFHKILQKNTRKFFGQPNISEGKRKRERERDCCWSITIL